VKKLLAPLRRLSAWQETRRAIRHLRSLSDNQLKDIGIKRGEIDWIAHGVAQPR
jgi:uncharacterized protein YjiS (DUF1127 family)